MADGGWNCAYYQGGSRSSLHTTIGVIEGLWAFLVAMARRDGYRSSDIRAAIAGGVDFILRHRLYRSERTGEMIKDEFFKFAFPVRWKYDVLRCLDLFRRNGVPYDGRMAEALDQSGGGPRPERPLEGRLAGRRDVLRRREERDAGQMEYVAGRPGS